MHEDYLLDRLSDEEQVRFAPTNHPNLILPPSHDYRPALLNCRYDISWYPGICESAAAPQESALRGHCVQQGQRGVPAAAVGQGWQKKR